MFMKLHQKCVCVSLAQFLKEKDALLFEDLIIHIGLKYYVILM